MNSVTNAARKICFMICPFEDKFASAHAAAVEAFKGKGYECRRTDQTAAAYGNFMDEVAEGIRDADVVLADISDDNPNVYYELGVAHTLHKRTVIIKQEANSIAPLQLPANLRMLKVIKYCDDLALLQKDLGLAIDAVERRHPESPVHRATIIPSLERLEDVLTTVVKSAMHPVTAVLIRTDAARVRAVSAAANRLFALQDHSPYLINRNLRDMLGMLKDWMDPEDFEEFRLDQDASGEAYSRGSIVYARVPVKFNRKHPDPNFRGKTFLPVIVGFTQGAGEHVRYATVLYLDLSAIPAR